VNCSTHIYIVCGLSEFLAIVASLHFKSQGMCSTTMHPKKSCG